MSPASHLIRRFALAAGLVCLFTLPTGASVQECIDDCRQQRDADRQACEELLNPEASSVEGLDQAWPALLPVDSRAFRTQVGPASTASGPPTSPEYRDCINAANRAFAACAQACTPPSPSGPRP